MKTILSEKGQITIPKRLREHLGLRPGEALDFVEQDGKLVGTKIFSSDPVDAVYGILVMDQDTDRVVARFRGNADPR